MLVTVLGHAPCNDPCFFIGSQCGECPAKQRSGPPFNIKIPSFRYGDFHCREKTVVRPSFLTMGIAILSKDGITVVLVHAADFLMSRCLYVTYRQEIKFYHN